MRIAIDAPAVRSLSANEKMVYQFLRQGLTVQDIAHRMKLPVGKNNFFDNRYDVPNETVMGLVTSIREKGWDIPTDNHNKEENEMPIVKLSEEDKRNIVTANQAGASVTELAAKYHIAKGTVYNIVSEWKKKGDTALSGETEIAEKEPETAATESGSEENVVSNDSADIVTPSGENVKPPHSFSPLVAEAIWSKIEALRVEGIALECREAKIEERISELKKEAHSVDEQLMFVEAEIGSLLEDYEALTGGAAV
jgi:transposase